MSGRGKPSAGWWLVALSVGVSVRAATAQPPAGAPPAAVDAPTLSRVGGAEEQLSAYLDRPGLRGLLAEQLTRRLQAATGEQRAELAERLGRVYIELLNNAESPAERKRWEDRANDLARLAPDAQSLELRIDLARASYSALEEQAERYAVRGEGVARDELVAALRGLQSRLEGLGSEAQRRVDTLQRAEQGGRASERLSDQLADGRRLRSTAYYYAGWSAVYAAMIERDAATAEQALRHFGVIVNGPAHVGRAAMLDRLSKGFLRYEHVARAAIGCALATSVKGDDVGALRWLDAVAEQAELPVAVKGQLPVRRLVVLAHAKRWAEVERLVRELRTVVPGSPATKPLEPRIARLLAVVVGEAGAAGASGALLAKLGQTALQDLIAGGQLDQVAELVTAFPELPLGDSGFVPKYVRGMRAYQAVRRAHAEAGLTTDQPAKDPALANQWREAAGLLLTAADDPEAANLPRERAAALLAAGRALSWSGEASAAAERFTQGHAIAPDAGQKEELLWMAAVALDGLVRGGDTSAQAGLDRVAALYLRENPQNPRSAELLIRMAMAPGIDEQQALATLMAVPRDSAVYDAARRQVSRLLYRQFRAAGESDRPFIAGRLIPIAEEVLGLDRRMALASETGNEAAKAAGERVLLTARQMLDVMLAVPEADTRRAEAVLGVVELVAAHVGLSLDAVRAELLFRRLQIALARDEESAMGGLMEALRAQGADGQRFIDAGERAAYQLAVRRWEKATRAGRSDLDAARLVVTRGRAVLTQITRGGDPRAIQSAAVVTLHRTMAEAATQIGQSGDAAMCDVALDLDNAVLEVRAADGETLTRMAVNSECAGQPTRAIEIWTRLMDSTAGGTPLWFRARTESLRLLVTRDGPAAAAAFAQLRVLYPGLGPEPYRSRLLEIERQIPPPTAPGVGGGP
jgi:hypothetical protein